MNPQLTQPAPRARGDGPLTYAVKLLPPDCSPRTRGWSLAPASYLGVSSLLPAHAGMVPR